VPETNSVSTHLPLMAMAGVIVLWGAGPVITKLITVHPLLGAALRFGLSIPVLLAIVRVRGGSVDRALLRRAMMPGLAFGVNLMFVFAAVQEVTVAVLAVAVALQPAFLLLVAGPLFDEPPSRRHVVWTFIGVAAAAGVILGAGEELRASLLGVALALAAVVTFTIYFVLTRMARFTDPVDPFEWMAAINIWALVSTLFPVALIVRRAELQELDGADWFWLAVLAYLTGVAGHVLMSWVHGYIEAARSSLYLLAMNVVAVSLAWPVHGEPVTVVQFLCGLVVFTSVGAVVSTPARAA